jgi:hypothetical protein
MSLAMTHAQPDAPHPQPPTCSCNGEALALVVTAPRVGPFPELHTYRCPDCGHVVTVEAD